jgi:hypothetical protein
MTVARIGSPEALEVAVLANRMDSAFENLLATSVRAAESSIKVELLQRVLSSEHANVRALGLRVLRRAVMEREVIDALLDQLFRVCRYSEIECWYHSILSRYPLMRLVYRAREQLAEQGDPELKLLHIRALEMWRAKSPKLKRKALAILMGSALNAT